MRYLILILLVLGGCSSEDKEKDHTILSLREKLDSTADALNTCQARLEIYSKPDDIGGINLDTSAPSEPQKSCHDVSYDEISSTSVKVTCLSDNVTVDGCGVNAKDCEDDKSYYCLQNVTVKTSTKEECY